MPCTKPQHAFAKHNTTDWKRNGQSQLLHSCEHICNYCYMVFNRPDTSRDLRKHLDYGACPRLPKDVTPKFHISHHPRSGQLSKQMPKEELIGLEDPRFLWYCRILLQNDVHLKQFGAYYNIIQQRLAPYNGLSIEYLASLAKDFTPDMPQLKLDEEFPDIGCGPGGKAIPLQIISIEGLSARPLGLRVTTSEMLKEKLSQGGGQQSRKQSQVSDGHTPPGQIPTPTAGFPRLLPMYGFQPPPPQHAFQHQPQHFFQPQPPLQAASDPKVGTQGEGMQGSDTFSLELDEDTKEFQQSMDIPEEAANDLRQNVADVGQAAGSTANPAEGSQNSPSKVPSALGKGKSPSQRTPTPPPVQRLGAQHDTPSRLRGIRGSSTLSIRTTPRGTPTPAPRGTPTPAPRGTPTPGPPPPRQQPDNRASSTPTPRPPTPPPPCQQPDSRASSTPTLRSPTPGPGHPRQQPVNRANSVPTPRPPTPKAVQRSSSTETSTHPPPSPKQPDASSSSSVETTHPPPRSSSTEQPATPHSEHSEQFDWTSLPPGSTRDNSPEPQRLSRESSVAPTPTQQQQQQASASMGTSETGMRPLEVSTPGHPSSFRFRRTNKMRKREITPHSPLGLSSDVDMDALVDDMEPPSSPIESPSKHISLFDDLEMADDAFESSDPQTQAPGGEEGTDGNGRSRSHRASTADTVPVGDKGHEQLLVKLSVDPVNLRALLSKGQEADGSGDVLQEDVSRSEASKTGSAPVDELPTTTNMDEDEDELSAEKLPAAATAGLSGNEPLAVGLSGTMQADKAAGLDSVGMPMDVDGEQHHERPTQITASERDSSPSDDKKTTEPRAAPQPIADTAQSKVVDTPGQETASSENIPEPPEVTHVRKSGRTRKAAVPKGSYTCSNDPRPPMAGSKRHERTEEEGLDSDKTTKRRRTSSAVGDDAEMEDSEGTAVTDQLHRETVPPAPADEPLASSSAATTESRSASAIQALSAPAKRNGSTRKQKKLASTSTSTAASAVAKNKPSAGSGIKSRPDPKTKAVEPKTKAGNSVAGAAGRNKPSGSSRTNSKADPKGPGNGKITRRGKGSKA